MSHTMTAGPSAGHIADCTPTVGWYVCPTKNAAPLWSPFKAFTNHDLPARLAPTTATRCTDEDDIKRKKYAERKVSLVVGSVAKIISVTYQCRHHLLVLLLLLLQLLRPFVPVQDQLQRPLLVRNRGVDTVGRPR